MGAYRVDYERSLADPDGFWGEQAGAIDWYRRPSSVLDSANAPFYRWFPDGILNTCYNALDRHVIRGRGEQPALIFHSAMTGTRRTYTYAELLERVAQFGGALRELGVVAGDRVVIYLPMVPEAVIAMLACARIGAVHSVVFGGFAPGELAARIDDAQPKIIISASCGLEAGKVIAYKPLLDAALTETSHRPDYCVIYQRTELTAELVEGRDIDFALLMRPGSFQPAVCVEVAATDPLYILYTSGHHGKPKGIVRDQRRARGRADLLDADDLRRRARRRDVHRQRRRLGGRPLLHRLRAAVRRRHDGAVRGQAGRHARRRRLLAGGRRARREGDVHRADRDPGDPQGRPGRRAAGRLRPLHAAHAVPGRRAARPRHLRVGDRAARGAGGRPLVADRDRLADRRQPARARAAADQAGLASFPVPGYDVQILDSQGGQRPPGQDGSIALRLPLPPGTLPTCGATTSGSSTATSRPSRATTSAATAAIATRTATCS